MNHYWGHNFNSISSLLGGAVVAGDAGNTAIFYNPATIGDMQAGNNLSLTANLLSWNFYNLKNALGDGIDLYDDNFLVQPQFISYSFKPKNKKLNLSFTGLTRIKEQVEMIYINSEYKDVVKYIPGDEKYNTTFNYRNDYTDSWIGAALSYDMSERFRFGASVFASISYLNYRFDYSAKTENLLEGDNGNTLIRIAEGSYSELVKFTDYRLIVKMGVAYKIKNWRLGLTLTAPSWRLFSSGKRAQRLESQVNINRNGLPAGFSDFSIFSGQEKNQLKTNFKLPLSVGMGFIHDLPNRDQKLYVSIEFFAPLKGYKMLDAQMNPNITTQNVWDTLYNKDWTSYAYAANPVLNLAVGYSWTLSNDLKFINALRTDFSSINYADLGDYASYNSIKTTFYNIYHYSGGVEFSIKRNKFIAGGDFAFGYQKNVIQIANFANPVEYEEQSGRALQGPIENTMDVFYYGLSIYVGATLNFSKKESKPKK